MKIINWILAIIVTFSVWACGGEETQEEYQAKMDKIIKGHEAEYEMLVQKWEAEHNEPAKLSHEYVEQYFYVIDCFKEKYGMDFEITKVNNFRSGRQRPMSGIANPVGKPDEVCYFDSAFSDKKFSDNYGIHKYVSQVRDYFDTQIRESGLKYDFEYSISSKLFDGNSISDSLQLQDFLKDYAEITFTVTLPDLEDYTNEIQSVREWADFIFSCDVDVIKLDFVKQQEGTQEKRYVWLLRSNLDGEWYKTLSDSDVLYKIQRQ